MEKHYGNTIAQKLTQRPSLEFLFKLAEERQTVCLSGEGFAGPTWSLRVALANLGKDDCRQVGKNIVEVLDRHVKSAV
jgi:aspartate 4-decarboxylase